MTPEEREMLLLWSDTDEYTSSIELANTNIESVLSIYTNPVCAFSGGKDSLVMTHMVLQTVPDCTVFHWDYGKYLVPRDIHEETLNIARTIGAKNMIVDGAVEDRTTKKLKWTAGIFGRALPRLKENGHDVNFVGLRSQESGKRDKKVRSLYVHKKPIDEAYPIRHMGWKDVWAYILENNLPYLKHYDKYSTIIPLEFCRFSSFFDPEIELHGASMAVDGVLMPEFRNVR